MKNTLGAIVWTYEGVGYYKGLLTGQFTVNKTFLFASNNIGALRVIAFGEDALPDTIYVNVAANGADADDMLSNTPIEIRVYP